MKASLLIVLAAVLTATMIGCKTSSQSSMSDEQKALIALSKTIPTDSPPEGAIAVEAGLDGETKTVHELVEVFMANRDWTESMEKKHLNAWQKTHQYNSPPVIIHEKQMDAAYQLIRLGPQAKAAAPAIAQSLTNSGFLTHQWALHQRDVDAADEERADFMNRHWAIQVLQAIGSASPEVVPALVCGLDDPKTGYEAADALINISLTDTNVLSAVIAKLESNPESPEAENSARVLNEIGDGASAAVPVLIQLLEHTNACDMVLKTLCTIGSNAAPAVPSLIQLYKQNQSFPQRTWIVITLGRIGAGAQDAVPMLKGLLNSHHGGIGAIRALWRINPQYTQLAIRRAQSELQAQATMDRNPACDLLGEIGSPAKSAVPVLLHTLNSALSLQVRFNAAWALWQVDPNQKPTLVETFENFYTNQMRPPIEDLSVDAAGALWQIEPERENELRPTIIAFLKKWKEGSVVRYARPEMKPLLPALKEIADDHLYAELRPSAIQMIRQLNGAGMEWWER